MIGLLEPRPPKPPKLREPASRVTGEPGLSYAASCLRSHSFFGAAPSSRIHVRVLRERRSNSLSSATPFSVYEIPAKRHSVLPISDGSALNGAASVITRSRNGTFVLGSPPSSASVHTTVAGWSSRQ